MASTSLVYRSLDAQVIAGHADDLALSTGGVTLSYAELLHESAVIAGSMAQLGVDTDRAVVLDGLDRHHEVIAVLALARLGAVTGDVADFRLTGRPPTLAVDDQDPVSWEVLVHAGRIDPLPAPSDDPEGYEGRMLEEYGDVFSPLLAGGTVS